MDLESSGPLPCKYGSLESGKRDIVGRQASSKNTSLFLEIAKEAIQIALSSAQWTDNQTVALANASAPQHAHSPFQ